jgi:putative transposase
MKLKSGWHCVYDLQYHLVLVTKYRKKCFTPEILEYLKQVFEELCKKWEIELKEFGGEEDHIHLLISAHPNTALSVLVNNLKTVSSRLVRKKYSQHLAKYYWKPILWTRSYCLISTGGATIEVIERYIKKQGENKDSNSSTL